MEFWVEVTVFAVEAVVSPVSPLKPSAKVLDVPSEHPRINAAARVIRRPEMLNI